MSPNIYIQTFIKHQFDAAVSLTAAAAKSIGKIVTEAHGYSTTSLQSNAELLQKVVGVKSVDELIIVQNDHAKASYEASVAWSRRFGELLTDLSTNAIKAVAVGGKNPNAHVKVPAVE